MPAVLASDLLLDTDVLIDHLRGARALPRATEDASYSVITRCELFAGHATDEDRVRTLLASLNEIAVDGAVAERAGRLRRERSLRIADALIAATALVHELDLVTRNRRDFHRVTGLGLRDPDTLAR